MLEQHRLALSGLELETFSVLDYVITNYTTNVKHMSQIKKQNNVDRRTCGADNLEFRMIYVQSWVDSQYSTHS